MAMKLESENVRLILMEMIGEVACFEHEGKDAEKTLCYVGGMIDMANAVIKAIKDLGGK